LRFGEYSANMLQIQVYGLPKTVNLKGRKIILTLNYDYDIDNLVTDDGDNIVSSQGSNLIGAYFSTTDLFTGYINSSTSDVVKTDRVLLAYDRAYTDRDINIAEWWNSYWTTHAEDSITLATFRNSMLAQFGIPYVPKALLNDDVVIHNTLTTLSTLTLGTVLSLVCQLQCCCPNINSQGKLEFVTLATSSYSIEDNVAGLQSTWKDFTTEKITGIGVYDTSKDLAQLIGTNENVYNLAGNIFLLGMTAEEITTVCTAILNEIKDIQYTPCTINCIVGNVTHNLGDYIATQEGSAYIMSQSFSGSLLVDERIDSPAMSPTLNASVDSVNDEFINGLKFSKITKTVDEISSEVYDPDTGESKISQLATTIILKVDANGKIVEAELSAEPSGSAFKILADNIDFIADDVLTLAAKNIGIQATNFKIDKTTGLMECKGGSIGGFTIDTTKLYNGMTSLSDTTNDGVYVGTDGIALGKGKFKVTNAGALTATSGNIGGILISNTNGLLATSSSGAVAIYPTGMIYITNSAETKAINLSNGTITANYGTSSTTISGGGIKIVDAGGADFYLQGPSSGARINFEVSGSGSYAKFSNLSVTGTKSRVVETEDYGDRLMYCYETPTPMFGDIGEGIIAEDGKCYIWLDPVFAQTINSNGYQVFLQKYGKGECYVTERKSNYFVVEGDAGLSFGWELKAKQSDYEMKRLDRFTEQPSISNDYGNDAIEHIKEIQQEREVV